MQKKSSLASMVMSKDENENEKEGRTKQKEPGAERPPPERV